MESSAKSLRDPIARQKAHAFVSEVCRVPDAFPEAGRQGIASRLRRAAVGVAADVAEGFRRLGPADRLRFFEIAQGSVDERLCYLVRAHDVNVRRHRGRSSLIASMRCRVFSLLT